MGRITTGVGLVSGINSGELIRQLLALEERPKQILQTRIDQTTQRRATLLDIQTRLTTLRLYGSNVKKTSTFRQAVATTSDPNAITATASTGAANGSFQVRVARLVTSQQAVSSGFATFDTTNVGAGTITFERGGGEVNTPTRLDQLNGGQGVQRGQIRITDRAGRLGVIDLSDALTLDDVVRRVNNNLDITVRAEIEGDKLKLTDISNGAGTLSVEEVGTGQTATQLGIRGSGVGSTLTGSAVRVINNQTSLTMLNDGRGIDNKTGQADFRITMGDGTEADVNLDGATTVGDIISRISTATGGNVTATLRSDGKGFDLVDTSHDYNSGPAPATFEVAALNSSTAARDLGLLKDDGDFDGSISGDWVIAQANTVLVRSLNGGSGMSLGTIRITGRGGTTADVDLSSAQSVQDVLDRINASTAGVRASVKPGGNGIQIEDTTGQSGNLVIANLVGSGATALGIEGTFTTATGTVNGANLQRGWMTRNTLLTELNGRGVPAGRFRISSSTGTSATVDISTTGRPTVGSVIDAINARNVGITASLNANGDGILLTDTAGGTQKLKVEDLNGGSTAKALNLAGTASGTTIDGTYEKTISITATDKLSDVQRKINEADLGFRASIINDGSGSNPFRLSLTTIDTGRAGRVVFDGGATSVNLRNLVEAEDAVVFYGGTGSGQPVMFTSSSNTIGGIVPGVTLNLRSTSTAPISIQVSNNVEPVLERTRKFVEDYNALITRVRDVTRFDTENNARGILLGESSVQSLESELSSIFARQVNDSGRYRIARDVGLRVGSDGQIELDEDRFRAAWADDPDAVTNIFARAGASIDEETRLSTLNGGRGVRTVSGNDFSISTRDGTNFNIELGDALSIGDVISTINTATSGKITASFGSDGTRLVLTDNTTGNKRLTVSSVNGSVAALDLGIQGITSGNQIQGKQLVSPNAGNRGGLGLQLERAIGRMIDPVSGVITRAGNQMDERTEGYQSRITAIDRLIEQRRARLERQFANLESTLAKLQGQQGAIANFQPVQINRN
jgi:flagellar hook-associated protein 2